MNRRLFGVRAQVRGRRLERLIAELNRRGVRICDMRRGSLRALDFCIRRRDVKALRAACGALDVTVESLTPLGADGALAFLKRRMALPVSAAVCVLIIGLIGARVWRVEVDAPTAELRAQVEYALGELGARPGAMKSALDLKSIESAITSSVEGVKFCQARVRGVVFTLTAQQVSPAPDVLSLTPAGGL